jgi:hypothetical protein
MDSKLAAQLDGLNPQQKAVALHDGHCLAIAAPGSGKTKTLAVKAALLLSRGKSVTAVTFTGSSIFRTYCSRPTRDSTRG